MTGGCLRNSMKKFGSSGLFLMDCKLDSLRFGTPGIKRKYWLWQHMDMSKRQTKYTREKLIRQMLYEENICVKNES